MGNSSASPFSILFVDDEAQARKYFHRAYARDFEIITVADAREARQALESHADTIGVIITDQRMPGESGVSLLTHIRAHHPGIVRILTTAYSDIDSAIDAVNEGAVFRYVTKPWDVHELRGILHRAMEMHQLQRERDALLREKRRAADRPPTIDRLSGVVALAAALQGRIDHPLHGLRRFIEIVQQHPAYGQRFHTASTGSIASPTSEADQVRTLLTAVDEAVERLAATRMQRVDIGSLWSSSPLRPSAIEFAEPSPAPPLVIWADVSMVRHGLDALAHVLTATAGDTAATVRATVEPAEHVHEAPGVSITLSNPSPRDPPDAASPIDTTALDARLLTACLVAAHHGGQVALAPRQAPDGPDIYEARLELPAEPARAHLPPLGEHWIEDALGAPAAM